MNRVRIALMDHLRGTKTQEEEMLDPKIRQKRLRAEHERVRTQHERKGLFAIEQEFADPPDRYVFRFACRGIAEVVGGEPLYAENHLVAIVLTDTYPTTAPL